MEVKGRNLAEGIPRSFTVSSNEILEALTDPLNSIVSAVKSALEHTPPELGADIAERGMVLTGGGALLRDVDRLLMEETGLPVIVADDPLTCVVRGCGKALENMDKLSDDLHVGLTDRQRGATRRSVAVPHRCAVLAPPCRRPTLDRPADAPPPGRAAGVLPSRPVAARAARVLRPAVDRAAVRRHALPLPRGHPRRSPPSSSIRCSAPRSCPARRSRRSATTSPSQRALADENAALQAASCSTQGAGGAGLRAARGRRTRGCARCSSVESALSRPRRRPSRCSTRAAIRSRRSSSSTGRRRPASSPARR